MIYLILLSFFLQERDLTREIGKPSYVLYFTASWCGPCQQIKPELEALKEAGWDIYPIEKYKSDKNIIPIIVIDTDYNQDLVEKYGVDKIPCFIKITKNGEVKRSYGAIDRFKIVEITKSR